MHMTENTNSQNTQSSMNDVTIGPKMSLKDYAEIQTDY